MNNRIHFNETSNVLLAKFWSHINLKWLPKPAYLKKLKHGSNFVKWSEFEQKIGMVVAESCLRLGWGVF